MVWDLVAGLTAAVAVGGMVLFLRRVLRVPLPKWAVPAAAGAAMVSYAIWSEYSWFDRMGGALPERVEIAMQNESRAPWRPWTYLRPITTRFVAFDRAAVQTHPNGLKQATLLLFSRWEPTRMIPVAYDCAARRQATLAEGAVLAPDGTVTGTAWLDLPADDPILTKVCAEG